MKFILTLLLLTGITQYSLAQSYKRNTADYSFSFTKDGKMKVVWKAEGRMYKTSAKEFTAANEIVLKFNKTYNYWVPITDQKVVDSAVTSVEYYNHYDDFYVFKKVNDILIISEPVKHEDKTLLETDPETGEQVEVYDDYGYPLTETIFSGGYTEVVTYKDGKVKFKKENTCLDRMYGDKVFFTTYIPAEDTYYQKYTMLDASGNVLIDDKAPDEIYENDAWLSFLINEDKADKILFKYNTLYLDKFAYQKNGKMGYSSIMSGVLTEAKYEFCYADYSTLFYLENGLLKAESEDNTFEAKSSLISFLDMMSYFSEWFADGKSITPSSDENGNMFTEGWQPSFGAAESFLKIGHLVIYSYPYYFVEKMYDGTISIPSDYELGNLIIYDTKTKQIIWNEPAMSLMNFTDKAILLRKITVSTDENNYGQFMYSYHVLDLNAKPIHSGIPLEKMEKDPSYLLSLLPTGATALNLSYYNGLEISYYLNDKVGLFSENSQQSLKPEFRWYLYTSHSPVKLDQSKIYDDTDTLSYSGNYPYCLKEDYRSGNRNQVFGTKRIAASGYTNPVESNEKISWSLIDTSYTFFSIEFKDQLVIQNSSWAISANASFDYDPETYEAFPKLMENGEQAYYYNYNAESGVFDTRQKKWIIAPEFYRVAVSGKYFVASSFAYDGKDMGKNDFIKMASNPQFTVFDLQGKLILKGTAAEVKKKIGTDPAITVFKY